MLHRLGKLPLFIYSAVCLLGWELVKPGKVVECPLLGNIIIATASAVYYCSRTFNKMPIPWGSLGLFKAFLRFLPCFVHDNFLSTNYCANLPKIILKYIFYIFDMYQPI